MRGGKSYGQCGFEDGITDILKEAVDADGIAFGGPVFLGDFNAQLKAFIERFLFPFASYARAGEFSIAPKKIRTAVFSTMNVSEEIRQNEYAVQMSNMVNWIGNILGYQPETCYTTNTYQFTDYSRYAAGLWDESAKKKWKEEQFPKDCVRAFEIGKIFAEKAVDITCDNWENE